MRREQILLVTTLSLALLLSPGRSAKGEEGGVLFEGTWTRGGYSIEGSWKIVEQGGKLFLVLDEDFKTRRAPDLKIFLSPLPLDEVGDRNATLGSALVASLVRAKGAQRFALGEEVDLGAFRSLLIHCESFSKYWGGSRLGPRAP